MSGQEWAVASEDGNSYRVGSWRDGVWVPGTREDAEREAFLLRKSEPRARVVPWGPAGEPDAKRPDRDRAEALDRLAGIRRGLRAVRLPMESRMSWPVVREFVRLLDRVDEELDWLSVDIAYADRPRPAPDLSGFSEDGHVHGCPSWALASQTDEVRMCGCASDLYDLITTTER